MKITYSLRPHGWLRDDIRVFSDDRFTPDLTVFEPQVHSVNTGLVDVSGNPIVRTESRDSIGFIRPKE